MATPTMGQIAKEQENAKSKGNPVINAGDRMAAARLGRGKLDMSLVTDDGREAINRLRLAARGAKGAIKAIIAGKVDKAKKLAGMAADDANAGEVYLT